MVEPTATTAEEMVEDEERVPAETTSSSNNNSGNRGGGGGGGVGRESQPMPSELSKSAAMIDAFKMKLLKLLELDKAPEPSEINLNSVSSSGP